MTDYKLVPTRDDMIQCLLATRGQSEGVTADAILSMLAAAPAVPAVQEPSRKDLYSEFSEWCQKNRSFDLDCRLHTHGGTIDNGGYISDEMTRVAFAAYCSGRTRIAKQPPFVSALVEALERIVAWPDGGNHYGQANIKVFAAEALTTYRNQGGGK